MSSNFCEGAGALNGYGSHMVTLSGVSRQALMALIERAALIKAKCCSPVLQGCVVASCFFEASTRTRLSFEAAVYRQGGQVIGFADAATTSAGVKGETLHDSVRVLAAYADAMIIRHPEAGAAARAADLSTKPVINAGDGANCHPTQSLLDLFTIYEHFGTIDGLTIAIAGDLKYGRTVHSLVTALCHFRVRIRVLPQNGLDLPENDRAALRHQNIDCASCSSLQEVLAEADVLYMTRLQRERLQGAESRSYQAGFQVTAECLRHWARPRLLVMHPLPRGAEIAPDVDNTAHAGYFSQAENGLYMRQALLQMLLADKR